MKGIKKPSTAQKNIRQELNLFFYSFKDFLKCAIAITNFVYKRHSQHFMYGVINSTNLRVIQQNNNFKVSLCEYIQLESKFISPEQRGDNLRITDNRTDQYALGILFYEMLTKRLPEKNQDGNPVFNFENNKTLPYCSKRIIEKLTMYHPEDRYDSLLGLRYDLEYCLDEFMKHDQIISFVPGLKDVPTQLIFGDYLYGRETELEILNEEIEKVKHGSSSLCLVKGYSGVGKTSLINGALKNSENNVLILEGKFDQNLNEPYNAIHQALKKLVKYIQLDLKKQSLWASKLNHAIAPNGQVLVNFIPEIENIIGPQPKIQDLNPLQSKNRFTLTLELLFKEIVKINPPLVLFLDDLQWADPSSLKLIKHLLKSIETNLLIIGAYRNNECPPDHPLIALINDINPHTSQRFPLIELNNLSSVKLTKQVQDIFKEIPIEGISSDHLKEQVEDMLKCSEHQAKALAELIFKKTHGNPLYTRQFLRNLRTQNLISLDQENQRWTWDIETIKKQSFAENVVGLMIETLLKLPTSTLQVLEHGASLGNTFSSEDLQIILGLDEQNIELELWKPLNSELIFKISDDSEPNKYKFAHDKIQQAAYELIQPHLIPYHHLNIAQKLYEHYKTDTIKLKKKLFQIVDHLEQCHQQIEVDEDKLKYATLFLSAGKQAKQSMSLDKATIYLEIGENLIQRCSEAHPNILYELKFELSEALFLNGNTKKSEKIYTEILEAPYSPIQKANVFHKKAQLYISISEHEQAAENGVLGIKALGEFIDLHPSNIKILSYQLFSSLKLNLLNFDDLEKMPHITDEKKLLVIKLYIELAVSGYFHNQKLMFMSLFKMLLYTLKYGQTQYAGFVYVGYGVLSVILGYYDHAYKFGKLGLKVTDNWKTNDLSAKSIHTCACLIHSWKKPFKTIIPILEKAKTIGLQYGDLYFASLASCVASQLTFFSGNPLDKTIQYAQAHLEIKHITILEHNYLELFVHFLNKLQSPHTNSKANTHLSLDNLKYDFKDSRLLDNQRCILEMILFYYFDAPENITSRSNIVEKNIEVYYGNPYFATHYFYSALAHFKLNKPNHKLVKTALKHFKKWAKSNPKAYEHQHYLLLAEKYSANKKNKKAQRFFEKAIDAAIENDIIQDIALIKENAGEFYIAINQKDKGDPLIKEAISLFKQWGALAKVNFMKKKYAEYLNESWSTNHLNAQ